MTFTCSNCDRPFQLPFKPTLREPLCRVCYAESRGDIDMALAEIAWRDGYRCGRKNAVDSDDVLVSDDLLKSLLVLTHPDHHPPERFQAANTATAQLNRIREKLRTTP